MSNTSESPKENGKSSFLLFLLIITGVMIVGGYLISTLVGVLFHP